MPGVKTLCIKQRKGRRVLSQLGGHPRVATFAPYSSEVFDLKPTRRTRSFTGFLGVLATLRETPLPSH